MNNNAAQTDNRNVVLAVAVAGVIQVSTGSGPFDWWDFIVGLVLVFVLATYQIPPDLDIKEMLALAGIWGMTITILLAPIVQLLLAGGQKAEVESLNYLSCWSVATLMVLLFMDYINKKKSPVAGA